MSVEVRDNRENSGIETRRVLLLVGGFCLMVAVALFGLHVYYRLGLNPGAVTENLTAFPNPELQPNPRQDYLGFRRRQNEQLTGYSWIDRDEGLAHIPIEDAMAFIVARGPAALDPVDVGARPAAQTSTGQPPDGAPRAGATLPASPYGTRP